MNKVTKYITIAIFSFIIVISTLSIPKNVYDKADMVDMQFGYPVQFITQDLTRNDPPFPWSYSFSSPWEHPFTFSVVNFVASYLIVFILVILSAKVTESLYFRINKR